MRFRLPPSPPLPPSAASRERAATGTAGRMASGRRARLTFVARFDSSASLVRRAGRGRGGGGRCLDHQFGGLSIGRRASGQGPQSRAFAVLTTNLRRSTEPGNLLLEVGEGNLPAQSVVVVSQISSVDKERLGERIGSVSDARVEQILAGLRFQQVSFFER
jgi:hypothetical protein